jgi:hypothetical protein
MSPKVIFLQISRVDMPHGSISFSSLEYLALLALGEALEKE